MAKIGQLVLAGGRWNDRQIISKGWIEASTTRKIEATDGLSYGYLWWLGRSLLNGREVHWAGALGRGGQSIRIVPELDLVDGRIRLLDKAYEPAPGMGPSAFIAACTVGRAAMRAWCASTFGYGDKSKSTRGAQCVTAKK
jgi:CubicO group peptidase (beta-lactamase class C family)